MRFGKTLRASAYAPWRDQYMDYDKLKALLRDDESDGEEEGGGGGGETSRRGWTEEDENRFCEEVFNVQLEKVAGFQEARERALREQADALFEKLRELGNASGGDASGSGSDKGKDKDKDAASGITLQRVREMEAALDGITNELRQLKRYSSLNYTGFLKIVKKHDRKRGNRYRVRPMMQVSLARRPFHAETGYAPLLAKLSLMYEAVHQYLGEEDAAAAGGAGGAGEAGGTDGEDREPAAAAAALPADLETQQQETKRSGERYRASKFWVHPDNLLEVKTMVLRHLPALVYSDSSAKEADATADPALTSLYLDSDGFALYRTKVEHSSDAPVTSLRLRWYGPLAARPAISLDQKTVDPRGGGGDAVGGGASEERHIVLKDKYVQPFLDGTYHLEKTLAKMARQGEPAAAVEDLRATAEAMQQFVRDHGLAPVLRANYVRTAFQRPADDRVRVSIDTSLVFVREDNLDPRRPCRGPGEWHRRDAERAGAAGGAGGATGGRTTGAAARAAAGGAAGAAAAAAAFADLPPRDVSRFPYAVLEIKVRDDGPGGSKRPAWVEDLMASHLVHPVPHFSKFVHGVAALFDDYVNQLPVWLSDLDRDIRRDPHEAFAEEELRRAQRAADEQVVGSFLGTTGKLSFKQQQQQQQQQAKSSPKSSHAGGRLASDASAAAQQRALRGALSGAAGESGSLSRQASGGGANGATASHGAGGAAAHGTATEADARRGYGTISSVLPSFSMTRYARWRRTQDRADDDGGGGGLGELPAGVTEPTEWLKNAGPLRIEPKVWLANERTFLKWQHICVLLGSLSVALYTAAAAGSGFNTVAAAMGVVYTAVAAFAGFWGWHMLHTRRDMIVARSGRDFDNMVGPVVVSVALMLALVLNLVFAYRAALDRWAGAALAANNSSVVAELV